MALGLRRSYAAALACILCSLTFGLSERATPNFTFLKDASEAPAVSHYDYIIVGGGTAGCPLAATLSEHFNVLLLERGGSPYDNHNISSITTFAAALADASPTSAAQRFISEDGVINTRARVLGGGSCLNAGFYTRASTNYIADARWDGELVNASYQWVEKVVAFEPEMRAWQSAVRDGLLEAGVKPYNGFTYDHVYGTKVGGTIFDRHGRRHTAADLLKYADPRRLTVLLRATVERIVLGERKGRPAARGVVFRDGRGGRHRALLRRGEMSEVVVAAGALGSPQLLMLSGVGPRRHLEEMGIRVVVDNEMVGEGMADNPMNAVFVPSPAPVELSLIQVVGITEYGTYIEAASGAFFSPSSSSKEPRPGRDFGMLSPQTGQLFAVPPKQRTPEAIARATEAMNNLPDANFRGGFILEKTTGPVSKGHLKLKNRNPDDNPSVTFNYFKEPKDLRRCVAGIKTIERVIQSKAFSKFTYPDLTMEALLNLTTNFPVNLLPRHSNDSTSLEQYCKDTVMSIWHYHGGCLVGQVVDHEYKVLGVDSLRVIDGSTFNYTPGTNPQATVMMLGRYMGSKIRFERLKGMKWS